MSVADIGIGEGLQALALAAYLQPAGRVYATDVNEKFLSKVRDAAAKKALRNVTTVLGDPNRTNLPDLCCDAMLIRNVYHHFGDPPAMNASLLRGLRPGGRLLVIDFEPDDRRPYPPSQRASGPGHGVGRGRRVEGGEVSGPADRRPVVGPHDVRRHCRKA